MKIYNTIVIPEGFVCQGNCDCQDEYNSGYTAGYDSGYTDGVNSVICEDCTTYYESGYTSGLTDGFESGYTAGYDSGYTDGQQESGTPIDYNATPLTLDIIVGGVMEFLGYPADLEYSMDNGETWELVGKNQEAFPKMDVHRGDKMELRANGCSSFHILTYDAAFLVYGNIMSLLYATGYTTATTIPEGNDFANLFADNRNLVDAENLVLPATALTESCYIGMFHGCPNLTSPPKVLPALYVPHDAYQHMFSGCELLPTAPVICGTTLEYSACEAMFMNCKKLRVAPELPATQLDTLSYWVMFNGCSSLVQAPTILPATILAERCYDSMFADCTSLTTAPELPAQTVPGDTHFWNGGAYAGMFYGCTNLNYVKCLATNLETEYDTSTEGWLDGVAASGTFVKDASMNDWEIDSVNGIPAGWTVVNA